MSNAKYLTGPQVRKRQCISDRTLHRRENDPALGFPKPIRIKGRKYYLLSEIEAWESQREVPSASASATLLPPPPPLPIH